MSHGAVLVTSLNDAVMRCHSCVVWRQGLVLSFGGSEVHGWMRMVLVCCGSARIVEQRGNVPTFFANYFGYSYTADRGEIALNQKMQGALNAL